MTAEELRRARAMVSRLRRGPAPRGARFELCREVIAAAPDSPESLQAARLLIEGAMADATTSIADAQEVMQVLKALDRDEVTLPDLLSPR
ncbi:MAG: hypothetical protein V1750_07855 [Acidobacteriota bacterium]